MDDLSGLKWIGDSSAKKPSPMASCPGISMPSNRPHASGQSTPLSLSASRSAPPSKPSTPANDSFANLVHFDNGSSGKNLSLAERQRQLKEQKQREEKQKRDLLDAQYGGNNEQFWNTLGGSSASKNASALATDGSLGTSSISPLSQPTLGNGSHQLNALEEDEDDILAAFNASAPVDKSTNFPIPSSKASPAPNFGVQSTNNYVGPEDDDPFGLGGMSQKQTKSSPTPRQADDDDDILGLLAKPVSEFPRRTPEIKLEPDGASIDAEEANDLHSQTPVDRAIAELVDMGFPAEKASEALSTTESGTDIQAAVGWLLNQAHAEAKEKARGRSQSAQAQPRSQRASDGHRERLGGESRDSSLPTRTRPSERSGQASPNRIRPGERDAAQMASDFGNNFFKSANSLWKSGTKRVQQAVQEFNSTGDPNQPRWMREERTEFQRDTTEIRQQPSRAALNKNAMVTDEALMLEMERASPHTSSRTSGSPQPPLPQTTRQPREDPSSRAMPTRPRQPQQNVHNPVMNDSRSRLSRLAADQQASQAYVSPSRRRRPSPQIPLEPQTDLLEGDSKPRPPLQPTNRPPNARPPKSTPPVAPRPKAPPRNIPEISSSALSSSHKHRQDGSAAFKRGDYAAAHAAYTSAISLLPNEHPIVIVLFTNRALTALKTGEPKSAISDADRALSIIGPGKGESETIDLRNGEPSKEMREFFGKAMMRKAEALEQLERWTDAAAVWRETVEAGHGGSTSIQGRTRCERAAGTSQAAAAAAAPKLKPSASAPPRAKPLSKPAKRPAPVVAAKSAEAVTRLRAANEAADRLDNEKFELADAVEARLTAWKGGKQDNLRALLASLDTVLWAEAGWKKLSMAELVLPNKVKIHYMKGIAKVHPDKIPVNATTEQRMIAGAVFSTLNDAWEKFKQDNGL